MDAKYDIETIIQRTFEEGYMKGRYEAIDEAHATILVDVENGQEDLRQALYILENMKEENR